jgi:hypothetical protein
MCSELCTVDIKPLKTLRQVSHANAQHVCTGNHVGARTAQGVDNGLPFYQLLHLLQKVI